MNPILDQALVLALILAALGYLIAPFFRRNGLACGGGCRCSARPVIQNPPRPEYPRPE